MGEVFDAMTRIRAWGARHPYWVSALPGLLALIAILVLQATGTPLATRLSMGVTDAWQRAKPRAYEDVPVRIVDIDDESIRRIGQWPWSREQLALLTERLAQAGAAVVAYDVVFSEADRTSPARLAERVRDPAARAVLARLPDPDARFASAIAKSPVVLGYFLTRDGSANAVPPKAGFAVTGSQPRRVNQFANAIVPLPALTNAAVGTGFVSTVTDTDGIVRRTPLIAEQRGQLLPSLALEALRVAQGAGSVIVKSSDASGETAGDGGDVVSIKVGAFEVPTTRAGEMWLHYTRPRPERSVAAWRLMQGATTPAELDAAFGGRIVFVGTGAIGLRDLVATPLESRAPGVAVHAQAAEQVILGRYLQQPDWAPGVERALLLLLGLALALLLPRLGASWGALLGGAAIAALIGASWFAFDRHGFLIDPVWPVLGLVAVYAAVTIVNYVREERRRAFIHGAFGRYLAPEVVRRIAADPGQLELGGEERDMTVLFCDIRGFSRISEGMSPQEVIRFLIAFLTPMCDVLTARKATIDKFIGDAILAFWNAPLDDADHPRNAARGALEMIASLKRLNIEMGRQSAEPWPGEVRIGIGLNTGPCCVGNMGAAQRLSYSLIGDTVNLASRIEGLTKFYGVDIAIGSALAERLADFATVELDRVRVVGRDAPETLYALLGDEMVAADAQFAAMRAAHGQVLAAYRARDWDAVDSHIARMRAEAERFGLTKLHALIAARTAGYREKDPGPLWDGVFLATDK